MTKSLLLLSYFTSIYFSDKGMSLKVHFGLWSSNHDSIQKVLERAAQNLQVDEHLISRKRAAFSNGGSLGKAGAQLFLRITRNQVRPYVPYILISLTRGPLLLNNDFMGMENNQSASFLWTLHIIEKGNYDG